MANNQANVSKLNRRSFLTGAAMTGAAAMPSASAYAAGAPPEGEKRPNFLVIMVDQHNPACFGYAGHPVVQTPNIDRLAASSVNLSRAYVTNPVCMPSRASFFTGLTTRGHRVRMNGIPLSRDIPTMTESLRRSGYRTHCAGKLHFRTSGTPTGGDPSATSPEDFPEARAHRHREEFTRLRTGLPAGSRTCRPLTMVSNPSTTPTVTGPERGATTCTGWNANILLNSTSSKERRLSNLPARRFIITTARRSSGRCRKKFIPPHGSLIARWIF